MRSTHPLLVASLLLSACSTMSETFADRPHCGPSLVYCGTRFDIAVIAAGFIDNSALVKALGPFAAIDLPFSLVADTVLLPYTISKDLSNAAGSKGKPAAGSDQSK